MQYSRTRSPFSGPAGPATFSGLLLALAFLTPGMNAQQIQLEEQQVVPGPAIFPGTLVTNPTQPGTTLNIQSCVGVAATGLCATAPPSALNFVITPEAGWEARIITATGSPANYDRLATQGVANLMLSRGLTPGTSSNDGVDSGYKRFVVSRRSDARSGAFLAMIDAIQTVPFQRSAVQAESVNYLADQLKRKRIAAARIALAEFYKWQSSPCNYVPPVGFTYNPGPECGAQTLGSLLFYQRPVPPVAEYGAVLAFPELTTTQGGRALSDTAERLSAMAASIAVGGSAGLAFPRLAPSLASKLGDLVEPYRSDSYADRPPIRTAFLRFAGPVGALLSTVVDVIMASLDMAKYEQLEGNLKKSVAREEAAVVDLSAEILSPRGLPQLFSTFIAGTLFNGPDPANNYPLAGRGSLQVRLANPNSSGGWTLTTVAYRTWNNSVWQASISPSGWFVHSSNATQGHTDTVIQYMDWNNIPRSATYNPFTTLFTITDRNGLNATATTSLQIQLANSLNVRMTATLPPPPPTKFGVTEFRFGALSGLPDKDTDVIQYLTPAGQRWTARRSGSTLIHQPSQGGVSHSSNTIDLVLAEGPVQFPNLVAASCTIRPAGSSTDFLCTWPQDRGFVPRYVNTLRYFLDGITIYDVKLRP